MDMKLCVNLHGGWQISAAEQIRLIKKAGFDGFFPLAENWDPAPVIRAAKEEGLFFQSLHGPFHKVTALWGADAEAAEVAAEEIRQSLRECVECGAPILVLHTYKGFDDAKPTPYGPERFAALVDYAKELGVKIAFENVEGPDHLALLMGQFAGDDTVGFCWDTGHELCYGHSVDQLELYGDRLICTHLNDNMGISDPDGKIAWRDDLHLVPFDGIRDWQEAAKRLKKHGFKGPLTFELTTKSKPERHENDGYAAMSYEAYLNEAYTRAVRFAKLMEE